MEEEEIKISNVNSLFNNINSNSSIKNQSTFHKVKKVNGKIVVGFIMLRIICILIFFFLMFKCTWDNFEPSLVWVFTCPELYIIWKLIKHRHLCFNTASKIKK